VRIALHRSQSGADFMDGVLNYYLLGNTATSGQPTAEQFERIAQAGYTAVINLAMSTSDNALPDEGAIVSALGIQYHAIAVPFDAPAKKHFRAFVELMDVLPAERTWVHCALNARVSAFMFKYLHDVCGCAAAESSTGLLEQWRPQMDAVWQAFMTMDCSDMTASRRQN
jgi:protein tyrosine phosphatase (PTP) superfamily phosphohydrolase (DUF442 family)